MDKHAPGSRQRIEDLHSGIQSADPRKVKDALKAGTHTFQSEGNHSKIEINAMTAYFIEEIWSSVVKHFKQHPPGLVRSITQNFTKGTLSFFSEEEIGSYCFDKYKKSGDVLNFLREGTAQFLVEEVRIWSHKRELEASTTGDMRSRAYSRFTNLLLNVPEARTPGLHILRGMNTATFTIWETFGVLPQVYKEQFGTPMPKSEFTKLAKNSLPLIYALAKSHLEVFIELAQKYSWSLPEIETRGFYTESFHFSGERNNLKLELKEDVTKGIETRKFAEPRTGCPAIFSSGPQHKNVIAEMSNWLIDVAEKYYLPVLEREGLVV